jgi:Ca2+-binding RTX toxin-like protein
MKRVASLTALVGLILALSVTVALADTFSGNNNDNTIKGTNGNDRIYGRGGDDDLSGRGGHDRIFGQEDDDELRGHAGRDILFGEGGDDLLKGQDGSDEANGGPEDDLINMVGDDERDYVNCGSGFDRAHLTSNDFVDSQRASTVVTTTGLSCEVLFVDGTRIPQLPL